MNPPKKTGGSSLVVVLHKGGKMPRGFNFDQFDLDIAIALGEAPADTILENYTPFQPATEATPPSDEQAVYMKRYYGVKSLGSIAIPKPF